MLLMTFPFSTAGTKGVPGDKGDVGPNGLPGKGLDAKCLCKGV